MGRKSGGASTRNVHVLLTLACRNAWAMLAMSDRISPFLRASSSSSCILLSESRITGVGFDQLFGPCTTSRAPQCVVLSSVGTVTSVVITQQQKMSLPVWSPPVTAPSVDGSVLGGCGGTRKSRGDTIERPRSPKKGREVAARPGPGDRPVERCLPVNHCLARSSMVVHRSCPVRIESIRKS